MFELAKTRGLALALLSAAAGACGGPEAAQPPTWEEFRALTFREPESGIYIVDGDTPLLSEAELYDFWERVVAPVAEPDLRISESPLIVHRAGGVDAAWTPAQRRALTYCVSTTFGANYNATVQAMTAAAGAWEAVADVDFIHLVAQDTACTAANTAVVFDVRPVTNVSYLARAFFPNYTRSARNVLIAPGSFAPSPPLTLTGVLRHELGHALGFRHEHTRPESGACFEDNNWRPLTAYDSASVMHYPQCNGTNTFALELTNRDRDGASILYPRARTLNLTDSGGNPQANLDYWTWERVGQSFTPDRRVRLLWADVCAYDSGSAPSTATLHDGASILSPAIQISPAPLTDVGPGCGWAPGNFDRWQRAQFTTTTVLEPGRSYHLSFHRGGQTMGLMINDSQVNNGFNTNVPYSGGTLWDTYSGSRSLPTYDLNLRLGVADAY